MDSAQSEVKIEMPAAARRKGISGSTIKIIAVITMLIDHIGATILARQIMAGGLGMAMESEEVSALYDWMMNHASFYFVYLVIRMIGRLGFPIFCFLLVEGYQKTRDVRKYALRLALFALISEIPFNLAFTGKFWYLGYQNVYFTLFLGLFSLCAYDFFVRYRKNGPEGWLWNLTIVLGVLFPATYGTIGARNLFGLRTTQSLIAVFGMLCVVVGAGLLLYYYGVGKKGEGQKRRSIKQLQVVCADMTVLVLAMYLADLLNTDYSGAGVLTITFMYLFRKKKVLSMTAGCVVLTVMSISEIPAFLALIPIALYNGQRGLKMKYFFYAFYPVHLFLLYLLAVLLGLGDVVMLL